MSKKQLIVVGDRILIAVDDTQNRTEFGLYLPPGVKEKEKVRGGYVVKVGPGYPMPDPGSPSDEPWSSTPKEDIKYIPLQAQIGDYAIFLNNSAVEIEFEGKKYLVVPQSAILVLMRDDLPGLDLDDSP
ncbi:MAG: co-chaperone GroES family protein [Calditrichaeota bacterium]|nr:co-chaperone GroES family protein [Calditrichota bacterium]